MSDLISNDYRALLAEVKERIRELARNRFIEEGRDPDDEAELKSAIFP